MCWCVTIPLTNPSIGPCWGERALCLICASSAFITLALSSTCLLCGCPRTDSEDGSSLSMVPVCLYYSASAHCLAKSVKLLMQRCFVFLVCLLSRVPGEISPTTMENGQGGQEKVNVCSFVCPDCLLHVS